MSSTTTPWITFTSGVFACRNPDHTPDNAQPLTWCDHVEELINSGKDAEELKPGLRISVPVIPSVDIWTVVYISTDTIGQSALMQMEYTPDVGSMFRIPLGYWNPGEGMLSIRTCIIDQLRARLHPDEQITKKGRIKTRCPNGAHGLRASRIMDENSNDLKWKWTCLWNIAMEKACTPCIEEAGDGSSNNFGIDDSLINNKAPWKS